MITNDSLTKDVRDLLCELMELPTVRGAEQQGMVHLDERLSPFVDESRLVWIDDSLMDDPRYAFPLDGHSYAGSSNYECVIKGRSKGPAVVLNTHMDVVPPSEGQLDAFVPRVEGSRVFGRGACDAKGQIAALYGLARLYERHGPPPVDVKFHVVVEEENGGNGTLAMVRRGVDAGAAIVLEPSGLDVFAAVRGAVWFRLRTLGHAGHSGSAGTRVSALDGAVEAMSILRGYHDDLLARSRGNTLFDVHEDPMPITFGSCTAGAWPASIPAMAVVEGVLGFLPNTDCATVQSEMVHAVDTNGDPWLRDHFELTFPMLNNEGCALPVDHPLVSSLIEGMALAGGRAEVRGMTASCDAWLYQTVSGIPTAVFGPGSLQHAHGNDEQVDVDDVLLAARALHGAIDQLAERTHYGEGDQHD